MPVAQVLIETLWNVKINSFLTFIQSPSCINRNIVECKDANTNVEMMGETCINRNIVECKGRWEVILLLQNFVLIETLWNVK